MFPGDCGPIEKKNVEIGGICHPVLCVGHDSSVRMFAPLLFARASVFINCNNRGLIVVIKGR
jgi:hypothetical protein